MCAAELSRAFDTLMYIVSSSEHFPKVFNHGILGGWTSSKRALWYKLEKFSLEDRHCLMAHCSSSEGWRRMKKTASCASEPFGIILCWCIISLPLHQKETFLSQSVCLTFPDQAHTSLPVPSLDPQDSSNKALLQKSTLHGSLTPWAFHLHVVLSPLNPLPWLLKSCGYFKNPFSFWSYELIPTLCFERTLLALLCFHASPCAPFITVHLLCGCLS